MQWVSAKDKMGNLHTVTIYDDEYMKIDNTFFAKSFGNALNNQGLPLFYSRLQSIHP